MSLNTQNAASQEPVSEERRSIASTGRSDASAGNFERSEQADSVSTNESVQTGVGEGLSKVDPLKPAKVQLSAEEAQKRADQVIKQKPGILGRNLADVWRHLHPSVLDCLYKRQEALERGNIADEASLAEEAFDALSEDKKKAS